MRREFVKTMIGYADDPKFVFLTGDLGYKALEPLQEKMGLRFINAGIAEQNMVSVASGLAANGDRPWVYSIAPFLYKRAFEQIANDCCQPRLPVMIVGNGAGYGYGVMGPSHHALGDYGALLTLPNMKCYIPAFALDIHPIILKMRESKDPCYLRLGAAEEPKGYYQLYKPWRQLSNKIGPLVIVVGAIAGSYLEALKDICTLWVVTELPTILPPELGERFSFYRNLLIIEEHVEYGSFGQQLLSILCRHANAKKFLGVIAHRFALGYPSGKYGSKEFHRKESGLDKDSIVELVRRMT